MARRGGGGVEADAETKHRMQSDETGREHAATGYEPTQHRVALEFVRLQCLTDCRFRHGRTSTADQMTTGCSGVEIQTTDGGGVDERKPEDLSPRFKETTSETAAAFGAKTSSSLLRRHRQLMLSSSSSANAMEKPANRHEMMNDSGVVFAAVGRFNARPRVQKEIGDDGEERRGPAATADDEDGFRRRHSEQLPATLAPVERMRRRRDATQSPDGVMADGGAVVVKRGMSWLAAAMISVCAEDPCKCYALARDRLSKTVLVSDGSVLQQGAVGGGGRPDYYYYDYDDGIGVDGTNCPPYEQLAELTTADSKRKSSSSSSPASPNRRRPKPGMRQWRYDGAGIADRRLLQLTRKP